MHLRFIIRSDSWFENHCPNSVIVASCCNSFPKCTTSPMNVRPRHWLQQNMIWISKHVLKFISLFACRVYGSQGGYHDMDSPVSQKTGYDASIFFHQYDHANGNALLVFYCLHYYHLFALDWRSPSGSAMSISSTTIFVCTAPQLYATEKLSYQSDSWLILGM